MILKELEHGHVLKKTAGVCQLVGSCPFRLHSQYACHILAKQYIFQRWFMHV